MVVRSYFATAVLSHVLLIIGVLKYKCLRNLYRNLSSYKYVAVIIGTTTKVERKGGGKKK